MHPSRRRKKRTNYGVRTVEVMRGPNGFGFTISGQQPCILSCIVSNSPADQAGLRAGDFLISVNGVSVSKVAHDVVVCLIGNCLGSIKMTIAENYFSDSTDEELDCGKMINSRKPKYMHKLRSRLHKSDMRNITADTNKKKINESKLNANVLNEASSDNAINVAYSMPGEYEASPIQYKTVVGYLGTIEMPKQMLPNSRLQTVCSCIRKLRQEKRMPTTVLMTILPTYLTLKNDSDCIVAVYPLDRVVYVGSIDRESRYFGLVTSAVCDTRNNDSLQRSYREDKWKTEEKTFSNINIDVDISNSCHVFVTDPKLVAHNIHQRKAEHFKITCTKDPITGNCLEFPQNAIYIVHLIQNIFKLQNSDGINNDDLGPLVADSPQPSASSNSDSGIGFRDDCRNISDRILVVEFPIQRPLPQVNNNNRPCGIDASNMSLQQLDFFIHKDQPQSFELNNAEHNNISFDCQNNLSRKNKTLHPKQLENLDNIRACETVNIKNQLEKNNCLLKNDHLVKQNNSIQQFTEYEQYPDRLTCRALPNSSVKISRGLSPASVSSDDNTHNGDVDTLQIYSDVPDASTSKKYASSNVDLKKSVENISVRNIKDIELVNLIDMSSFKNEKSKQQLQTVSSWDNLGKYEKNLMNYKLSPKVYGVPKPNYSCEELNNFNSVENYSYGSLQELHSWNQHCQTTSKNESCIRIPETVSNNLNDDNGDQKSIIKGPVAWATSFEKLLEDTLGLHTFAEFLKKEFSAENIYFWTACERYRKLPPGNDRIMEAQRIYQQHLSAGAVEPVNVDAQGRQCTEKLLQNPDNNLFVQAQKQIFNLMKFDSYPRFLKSDIYKQHLSGEMEKFPPDVELMVQTPTSTQTKLKKSLSNAEDRRRKSLLPWHRKNRSKSKDRGDIEFAHRKNYVINNNNIIIKKTGKYTSDDSHSSHSSLTSLDLALTNQDAMKLRLESDDELTTGNGTALCRVFLNNGYTSVVQIKELETIQQLISRLLDKRGIAYSSFEIFTNKHPKALDISESSSKLAGCEVTVEQRVVFKLELPNRKIISVKSKYTKILIDVLRPILHKYHYNLDQVQVINVNKPIDLHLSVTSIDGERLNVRLLEDIQDISNIVHQDNMNNIKTKQLDEITNKVFESILQEKAESVPLRQTRSDNGSVKSEYWGSEHSSGIFGKFLRKDSGMHNRKKKLIGPRFRGNINGSIDYVQSDQSQIRRPLIAKWKAGASRLNVMYSESDELVEGLTRAQRCRLEDQRGTEINFELPDFLKDKEQEHDLQNACRRIGDPNGTTRFYIKEAEVPSKQELTVIIADNNVTLHLQSNHDSQSICAAPYKSENHTQNASQGKISSEESFKFNRFMAPKRSILQTTVAKNKNLTRNSDPPPLPPKPKIVPIKPPNWGQLNGVNKLSDLSPNSERNNSFLEQPSSSFV